MILKEILILLCSQHTFNCRTYIFSGMFMFWIKIHSQISVASDKLRLLNVKTYPSKEMDLFDSSTQIVN